jgi:hypothetical protein
MRVPGNLNGERILAHLCEAELSSLRDLSTDLAASRCRPSRADYELMVRWQPHALVAVTTRIHADPRLG